MLSAHVMQEIRRLGRLAGIKAAEHYLLPPKQTSSSLTRKPLTDEPIDAPQRSSQAPHRYGATRPVRKRTDS